MRDVLYQIPINAGTPVKLGPARSSREGPLRVGHCLKRRHVDAPKTGHWRRIGVATNALQRPVELILHLGHSWLGWAKHRLGHSTGKELVVTTTVSGEVMNYRPSPSRLTVYDNVVRISPKLVTLALNGRTGGPRAIMYL